MEKNQYFQSALSNFVFGMTEYGTICHLVDHSYTIKQIKERLGMPVPYEKIQKTVWNYMIEKKILLLEPPDLTEQGLMTGFLIKKDFTEVNREKLTVYLSKKRAENGWQDAYVSCDFGVLKERHSEQYQLLLSSLDSRQRDYIDDLPWTLQTVYHCMNQRMTEILYGILRNSEIQNISGYKGSCYFIKIGEEVLF